ncbi:MAG TPA: site-2 protease family protein, partial [Candidatus Angelobacter sp.]|nr:site-2 protease family protein [Candidatus Angelobacter sp.]
IKSPLRSRADLFDIGIAGPITGFVVAVPVLIFGLLASKPLTGEALANTSPDNGLVLGFPLIFKLAHWALGAVGVHSVAIQAPLAGLYLHPAAVGAWIGMLATALNLLPGGQLDGGHIIFAVNPRLHRPISFISITILLLLSWFYWEGWLLWAVVLRFTGSRHPDVPIAPPLNRTRRVLAIFALIMLVLTLTPAPFVGPNNGLSGYFNKHKAEQQHIAPSK